MNFVKFNSNTQQAGKKEGGLGEGIFARLLTAPKARLGWERLRSLAPSREAKRNGFQFLLEEKGSRGKIENRENRFALRRRLAAGGAAGRVNSVQKRFELRSVIATKRENRISKLLACRQAGSPRSARLAIPARRVRAPRLRYFLRARFCDCSAIAINVIEKTNILTKQ